MRVMRSRGDFLTDQAVHRGTVREAKKRTTSPEAMLKGHTEQSNRLCRATGSV